MKTTMVCTIILFTFSLFTFLPHTAAEDVTEWGLPEGAEARLGKGTVRVNRIAYSPDGTHLAVTSGTGIWTYDAHTYQERSLTPLNTEEKGLWFSPDLRTRVSSMYDSHNNRSTINLWNWNTGELRHTLTEQHTGQVGNLLDYSGSVVFSQDGQKLLIISVSTYTDPDIKLWDVNTGERLHTFTEHTGKYFTVVFSPDGQKLLIASWHYSNEPTHNINLWDVNSGERLHTFTGDMGRVDAVFSPDGQTLAISPHSSGSINLWHVETGTLQNTLMTDAYRFNDVVFSSDGQTLVSSDSDDNVLMWDVKTGTVRQRLTGNRYYYYGIERFLLSPDGQTLAGAGYNEVALWDLKTGELLQSLIGHHGWINAIAFSPDGQTLASASSQDGTIRFWDVNIGEIRQTITGHVNHGSCLSLSPDGQTLASGGGRYIYLWDMNTRTLQQTFNAYTVLIRSISFSPDGQTIASAGQGSSVWLLDANSGALLWELTGHAGNYGVNSVAFSPDGKTLASGGDDDTIRLWNVKAGTLHQTLTGHTGNVRTVLFSPDGQTLASQSDSEVYLWDIQTGTSRQIGTEDGAEAGAATSLSIAFSPDGEILASLSRHRPTLRLWDVKTGAHLRTFTGYTHTGSFYADTDYLEFSPDGQTIASAGETAIQFWDLNTGEYHIGYTHTYRSRNVVFSSDGQTIASGHRDGTVMLWDIPFDTPEIIPEDVNDDDTATTPLNITELVAYFPFDGNPHDVSGNGNHGRIIGTSSYIDGKFGDALELDGDGYVEMQTTDSLHGDLFKTDPFTLAVWVYRETGYYEHVWRSLPTASGHNTLFIFPETGIISWRGFVDGVWSWDNLCETEPGVFETDTWVHIAVTNDGEKFRIYADGEKVAETDFQETDGGNATYRIGDFANHLTVDDYAVFSKALNTEEINLIMNTGVAQFLKTTQLEDIVDSGVPEDVNKDGTVNILDLVAVSAAFGQTGENDADVNGDGTVNILDLVAVSAAFGEVAAAPFVLRQQTMGQLTSTDVQQWLTQAQQANLTDPVSLRGILFLEQLLAALTPKETVLLPNYPNPFNPETWIPYQLAKPTDVTVTIYAADGKLVRTLVLGHQPVGIYQSRNRAAHWDGKNAVGEPVASGVYFYTLKAGDFSATRKMLIRK